MRKINGSERSKRRRQPLQRALAIMRKECAMHYNRVRNCDALVCATTAPLATISGIRFSMRWSDKAYRLLLRQVFSEHRCWRPSNY